MHKKESFFNDDGEEVFSRTIHYKGRFSEKGYSLYAHGKTISRRIGYDFPVGMTKVEIANMDLLAAHLMPTSNIIGYKAKRPMTLKEIGKVIGAEERQAYRFIKRMMGMEIVAKVDDTYIINPLYFFNGKTITDELYWLFCGSVDKHLSPWVRDMYVKRRDKGV